ncbi:MAG TPA: DUF4160 domain-containing protein [Reyranella sp.]|nr:DUF4160 domain-containing protein [Reyranella sp.]
MPTVHRIGDLRFVVFLDDHEPPHVHVFAGGGEAKLLLDPSGGRPSLVWARGFDRAALRRAMRETLARRAKLLAAWRRVHDRKEKRTGNG